MNRPRLERNREGYVSLLAMSFAFGLAVLGVAISVGLRAYLISAVSEERTIRTRITLESASSEVLGRLTAGGPVALTSTVVVDGRRVFVELTSPGTKVDPSADPPALVHKALAATQVGVPVGADLSSIVGLSEASRGLGLNARQEDCLRRVVTYGRAPARRVLESPTPQLQVGSATAGDQFDLRSSLRSGDADQVLWTRARLTGGATGWSLHDYRRLQGEATCVRP